MVREGRPGCPGPWADGLPPPTPRTLLPVHLISSLAFSFWAGHLGTLLHISKDWASQSIFFYPRGGTDGVRGGDSPAQALGSLHFCSDPDMNLLCCQRKSTTQAGPQFPHLYMAGGGLTKMEVRMGAFMIHQNEELMVSQHLDRAWWGRMRVVVLSRS